ncbi:hypothetical protein B0H10DRAFT_1941693 [Mycena sp. CBHHK59/15]|nr:hypothetical protein B0H10DRAFT_1941693 [Mycena sp. CBHHK59/15]
MTTIAAPTPSPASPLSNPDPPNPSPLGTPGPSLPGAFPAEADTGETEGGINILETAKAYLPEHSDVQRALVSASQVAKAYLPQGVAAYLPATPEPEPDPAPATPAPAHRPISPPHTHPVAPPSPVGGSRYIENVVTPPALPESASRDALLSTPPAHVSSPFVPADDAIPLSTGAPAMSAASPTPHTSLPTSQPRDASPSSPSSSSDSDGHEREQNAEGKPAKRKGRLLARLKEKMHVGHHDTHV